MTKERTQARGDCSGGWRLALALTAVLGARGRRPIGGAGD
jgi:hypothetical protein